MSALGSRVTRVAPWARRTEADTVLEIRGLCVDYGLGSGLHAVSNADLVLHRGEVLGLAGESGSGKSTLVYAATRLLRQPGVVTAGEVRLHSRPAGPDGPIEVIDLLAAGERELKGVRWSQISVVLQSALNALNPVITVRAEFDDVMKAHRPEMSRAERLARAVELLEMVGLSSDRLRNHAHELSGGQRQRVMIALALALEPQVVIMDEPTTALDVVTQREILEEVISLRDRLGFAMLFITHDLSLLIELADEIAVMYAGRMVERARADSLFAAPRHPYTYGLLNSFPPMHGERRAMTGIAGSPPDLRAVPGGCPFHPRCPYAIERCATEEPPLVALPGSSRQVACWLHTGGEPVPGELARTDATVASGEAALPTAAAVRRLPVTPGWGSGE
ncbi:MAG: ABC transporter ATP-binding protein [Acidimicrobiales bacterium]|jgi:peptide/nickel transport system ATP-binding protein